MDEGADPEGAAGADRDAVGLEGAVLLRVALDRCAALRVQSSPIVTSVFSGNQQPSSKTRRPIRTPSSRQITFLNGVPLKTWRYAVTAAAFQKRSCRQKSRS